MPESLRKRPAEQVLVLRLIFSTALWIETQITDILELTDRNDGRVDLISAHLIGGHDWGKGE